MSIEVENGGRMFCFYVSKYKVWPYEDGDFSVNYAKQECESLGMILTEPGWGYKYPVNQLACKLSNYQTFPHFLFDLTFRV